MRTHGRIEKALRRFRKQSNNCGHLRILRNRKTFESSHDKAIRKNKEAMMRRARARRSARSRAAAGF
jgi:ribosomal protein S21